MNKYKYVLGFMNYCSHDPAACITKVNIENGNIDYIFAEEGFISRKKNLINSHLDQLNIVWIILESN